MYTKPAIAERMGNFPLVLIGAAAGLLYDKYLKTPVPTSSN